MVLATGTIEIGALATNQNCPELPKVPRQVIIDIPDFNLKAGGNLTKNIQLTYVNLAPVDLDDRIFVNAHSSWFHIGKQSLPSMPASCYSTTTTNVPVTVAIPQGVQDGKYNDTLSISWPETGVMSESSVAIIVGSELDSAVLMYIPAAVGTVAVAAVAVVFLLKKRERQKKPFEQ